MNKSLQIFSILTALVSIAIVPSFADQASATQSREIAKSFGGRLQAALQEALTESGPTGAIDVCSDIAPQIASELSRQSGAKVRRTSLKFRNPANAPEPWEAEILRRFETQAEVLDPSEPLEYFAVQDDGSSHYLLAIRTGAVCLACHGTTLTEETEHQLEKDYPHDRARGYSLNEIRGAFSVSWPAPEQTKRPK